MKKKLISLLLAAAMMCSMIPSAFAANDEAIAAANALHQIGLFSGTGTNADGTPNFDLDRAPTRQEAITMLVKLVGGAEEAGKGGWETPFTDVDDWAKNWVGYAYNKGLTAGTSATTFGANDKVTAAQYITFLLKALGYDATKDFSWDKAWELSDKIGITHGQYNANSAFTRGDVAILSYKTLSAPKKGEDTEPKDNEPALENVLFEDQYVRIQYIGAEVDEFKTGSLTFKVWNKGAAFTDGISHPDLWVACTEYSINGEQDPYNSRNEASGCVVSAGNSVVFDIMRSEIPGYGDGIKDISMRFELNHGTYSGDDFGYCNMWGEESFTGEGFSVAGRTTAFVPETAIKSFAVDTKVPEVPGGELVYSDDNLELYFSDCAGNMVNYCVKNKTAQLLELACQSVAVGGKVYTDVSFMDIYYDKQAAILPHSMGFLTVATAADLGGGDGAGIVLDATIGTKKYTINVEDPNKKPETPTVNSADYAYLAGNDFRSIRRDYINVTPNYGYVYAYVDKNGDTCVLTLIGYKIISNYTQFTLHNMTTGKTIKDPDDYYDKQADRAYGANKLRYLDLSTEVLGYQVKCLGAIGAILETGKNPQDGVYVPPETLAL